MFSSRLNQDGLFGLELLIKVLSVVSVISSIEERWTMVMSLIPLFIAGSEHTIVGIFLDNKLSSCFGVTGVGTSKFGVCFEDTGESFASERGFAVQRGNWRSQFWVNYNVFCV